MATPELAVSPDFYVTGGTLRADAPSYVPRQADEDLFHALARGEFCYVLTSRQMGKSSLMARTAQRLWDDGTTPVILDLTAIGQNVTVDQWYGGLLTRLGRAVDLEDELDDFWVDHESRGPMQRWVDAIEQVVFPRTSGPIVIFIDEIDMVRRLSFSTNEFFAGIRECYTRRTENETFARLTFCLIGVATPSDLIDDPRVTPFNIGLRIELTDFTDEEASRLTEGLGRVDAVSAKLMRRVLHWTGGHPYLTQRLSQAVAGNASVTDENGVDGVCAELFFSERSQEQDSNLQFVRDQMLTREEVDSAALLTVYRDVRAGKSVPYDETSPAVNLLQLSGVTHAVAGHMRVRNRIYEHVFDAGWVSENMPDAELRRQREAYRRGIFRTAGFAAIAVAVVATLAVFARSEATQKGIAERDAVALLAGSQADTGRVMLREGNMNGLLYLAQARETADDMPELAKTISEEWALWHWQLENRLVQVFGHDAEVTTMGFSPDGALFVTGDVDGVAQLWDAVTGEPRGKPLNHGSRIGQDPRWWLMSSAHTLACFSADSRLLAISGEDGRITVWDTETTDLHLPAFRPGEHITDQMTFDPDGHLVVYATTTPVRRKSLWRWDMRDGSVLLEAAPVGAPDDTPMQGVLVPGGSGVFTVSFQGLTAVDTATGDLQWATGGTQFLPSVAWSESLVATGSFGGQSGGPPGGRVSVYSWHGEPVRDFLAAPGRNKVDVQSTPDGKSLLTVTSKGMQLSDFATGQPYGDLIATDGWVTYRAFSSDSRLLAGAIGSSVFVWDTITGELACDPIHYAVPVKRVVFHPTNPQLLAVQSIGRAVQMWDVAPTRRYRTLATYEGSPRVTDVYASGTVAFSPTDPLVAASSSRDKSVTLRDVDTGEVHGQPLVHDGSPTAVTFSPDGRRLAVTDIGHGLYLWDIDESRLAAPVISGKPTAVAFTSDGSRIAMLDEAYNYTLWDPASGETSTERSPTRAAWPGGLDFDRTGDRVLFAGRTGHTTLLRAHDMSQIGRIMQLNGRSYCARLSPGGLIVTTCEDGSAQLWDATTQRSVGVPLRHRFAVRWANFSADGRYVATASDDMTAQLWDVASQTPIGMPLRHTSAVLCVEFSPDGRYIATAAAQDARLWELPRAPETLIDVQEMTTLATGVRLNESDRIEPLPWREWRKLRSDRSTAR